MRNPEYSGLCAQNLWMRCETISRKCSRSMLGYKLRTSKVHKVKPFCKRLPTSCSKTSPLAEMTCGSPFRAGCNASVRNIAAGAIHVRLRFIMGRPTTGFLCSFTLNLKVPDLFEENPSWETSTNSVRWCLHKDFDAENCPGHTLGQLWLLNRIGYPLLQRLLPVISMTLRVLTFEASTRHQGFCQHPQHILSVGFLPAIAWLLCPQNLRWIFVNMARICKGLASTTYSTKQCLGVRVESTNSWVCTCCSLKNVWLGRQRKLQCVNFSRMSQLHAEPVALYSVSCPRWICNPWLSTQAQKQGYENQMESKHELEMWTNAPTVQASTFSAWNE